MRLSASFLAAITCLAAPHPAHADLIGDTISVEHGEPPIDWGGQLGSSIGRGPSFAAPGCASLPGFRACATGRQFTLTAMQPGEFEDDGHEYEFDDLSRNPGITAISLDSASAIQFVNWSIFQGSTVYLTFAGLKPFAAGDQAVFDLSFAADTSPVPEPASLAFLATGLVGAAAQYARRRRLQPIGTPPSTLAVQPPSFSCFSATT